jgi:hypothetical protein
MGAFKGVDARYDIISARVTGRELQSVQVFADDRKISRTDAVRLLLNIGLEFMSGGAADGSVKSMQGLQVPGAVLLCGSGE